MSHEWKMWVSLGWADGDMYSSIHLTEKGAFIATLQDMVEVIEGWAEPPEDYQDPGDLNVYSVDTLYKMFDQFNEYFYHTAMDFDVQVRRVMP